MSTAAKLARACCERRTHRLATVATIMRPKVGLPTVLSWMVFPWLLLLVVFAVPHASFALDIYVSVDGGAQADGSLAKPYGSLPDAVEAVRALRKAGNTEPAMIILREGRHQLNQTLVLGLEDGSPATSGDVALEQYGAGDTTGPAYLTFAAYPGEHPVVSGGVPVIGWKRLESAPAELPAKAVGKVWVADMPTGSGQVLYALR